ncbi:tripartite tricarboxylate transporter permease [Limnochorda pilosa]|uniref:tripartite tricarboxylate transporter permease n=1 Tax=Limnochorda pilosa TaxID=1555112 RepID=UPI0011876DFF
MDGIVVGLGALLQPANLVFTFLGTLGGILIGALPGLSSTMGVALLIPVTFSMNPATGLAMLGGVYCGSVYGGSITAILLRTPGTSASVATTFDGFELTKQGLGGKAIGVSTLGSTVGGLFSALALLFLAPPLAAASLRFGPPEYFLLAVFGLTIIVTISANNLGKGLISGAFAFLLGTVGMDPVSGWPRFTFGYSELLDGVPLLPALIGLFSMSQAIKLAGERLTLPEAGSIKDRVMPTWTETRKNLVTYLRSSVIGTFIGIIPGAGTDIASFVAYNEAKRFAKKPEEFGKGAIEGVAASEAANNAVTGGSLIPLLTLGIPGNAVSAVFLGGLTIHGLLPGASLFTERAEVTYTLILSLFAANLFMLVVGFLGAGPVSKVTKVSNQILAPMIVVLSVIGSYAMRNNMFDVYLMLFFGVVGYFLERYDYPLAPMVLGIILGPMAEGEFRRSMMMFQGSFLPFLTRPISVVLILLIIAALVIPLVRVYKEVRSRGPVTLTQ